MEYALRVCCGKLLGKACGDGKQSFIDLGPLHAEFAFKNFRELLRSKSNSSAIVRDSKFRMRAKMYVSQEVRRTPGETAQQDDARY